MPVGMRPAEISLEPSGAEAILSGCCPACRAKRRLSLLSMAIPPLSHGWAAFAAILPRRSVWSISGKPALSRISTNILASMRTASSPLRSRLRQDARFAICVPSAPEMEAAPAPRTKTLGACLPGRSFGLPGEIVATDTSTSALDDEKFAAGPLSAGRTVAKPPVTGTTPRDPERTSAVFGEVASIFSDLKQSNFRKRIGMLTSGLFVIIAANMAGQVYLNAWQGDFFSAVGKKDGSLISGELIIFLGLIPILLGLVA